MDVNQLMNFQSSTSGQPMEVHDFVQAEEGSTQFSVLQLQKQNMDLFWHQQLLEINQLSDFKQHALPLARIKRIMKSDEAIKMVSGDAPVVFSKACELFILELTLRAWLHTEDNKRRTLQRNDIIKAIGSGEVPDILVGVIPRDNEIQKEQESGCNGRAAEPNPSNGMNFPMVDSNAYGEYYHI